MSTEKGGYASDSVGLVEPQTIQFDEPLELACGRTLPSYQLVVETYGKLNADKSNALLVCHALSGDHHAAGFHAGDERPGWWDQHIGPGKPMDTDKYFVVSLNNIGGCAGSTGPTTLNSETGKPWGPDFPIVTVGDWVRTQVRLADRLGIGRWAAIV
ncbi:MAG: homoserine O-acetyltransferase, partial [Gammaproteobacteria bacterium]